jgi:hypothetical protein
MNRTILQDHLAQAERHVAEGEGHLSRQREIVTKLERDGHDSVSARATLAQFEELQAMHIADRDRLLRELSEASE